MTIDEVVKDIADTIQDSVNEAVKGVSTKYEARIVQLEAQSKQDVRPMIEEIINTAVPGLLDISALEKKIADVDFKIEQSDDITEAQFKSFFEVILKDFEDLND